MVTCKGCSGFAPPRQHTQSLCSKASDEKGEEMALRYQCEQEVIEKAMEKLKKDGLVSSSAFFNTEASGSLRQEVAYRDFDFLTRLCRVSESEVVRSIYEWLKQLEIIPEEDGFHDDGVFEMFRKDVKEKFDMPGTSITPVMERLLYMLSAIKKPKRVLGLGTYYGYALVWAIGASCGNAKTYTAEGIYGIDIDANAIEQAKANFAKLEHSGHIEFQLKDGFDAIKELEGPFDYVYVDVDNRELGKGIYLDLLAGVYEKIEKGGWVLAHDTCVPPFAKQLREYLELVRNEQNFSESISFDIDPFGLELSIK